MKKEGEVERVTQREKGYSIELGGEWFSGFGVAPVAEGEKVELEYSFGKPDRFGKPFKNVNSLVKVGEKGGPNTAGMPEKTGYSERDGRVTRLAVLNTSAKIHEIVLPETNRSVAEVAESVKKLAGELEEWVRR